MAVDGEVTARASAGQQFAISAGGELTIGETNGVDEWEWIEKSTPAINLDGRLIEDQDLNAHTANDIQHGLGRKLRGYIKVLDNTEPAYTRAYRNAALSIDDNTNTSMALDAESYDVGSNFGSNVFTAPVDGLYDVTAQVTYTGLGDGEPARIYLQKNGAGTETKGARIATGAASEVTLLLQDRIQLSASDTIRPITWYDGAAATEALNVASDSNYMTVRLVTELYSRQSEIDATKFLRLYSTCARTVSLWVF